MTIEKLAELQRECNYYHSMMIETIGLRPRFPVYTLVAYVRWYWQRLAWTLHCESLGLSRPPFAVDLW